MGRKGDAAEKKSDEIVSDAVQEEDPPTVKELKEIDDKYLELERQYEKEIQLLQKKFTEKQEPILKQRLNLLTTSSGDGPKTGTPALTGFWLKAMQNHPHLEDQIEEWDEPVLEYLKDVTKSFIDDEDFQKGFKLTFHFVENPYFTNSVLWKEYHTEEESPYTGEIATTKIQCSEIDWKDGKDVTVEKVAKKVKGGGAKKAKAKGKEKEEPRDSFFRNFFRTLESGGPIPDDVNLDEARQLCEDSDDEDEDEMMALLIENDYEMGCAVRDQLVPFAIRWYTGEAAPEDDEDSDDGDDDDDDDCESDDDDEDSDEEDTPKKKKGSKKKGGKSSPEMKPGEKPKEECKQQ